MTRQFLAQPSGNSRLLSGAEPQNLVPRRAGHGAVNRRFSQITGTDPASNVGLTLFLEEHGDVSIEWRSISVNAINTSFSGDLVPEYLRPQIIEDIGKAIDRTVRSR